MGRFADTKSREEVTQIRTKLQGSVLTFVPRVQDLQQLRSWHADYALSVAAPQKDVTRSSEFVGDRKVGIVSLLAEEQPSQRMSKPEEIGAAIPCGWRLDGNHPLRTAGVWRRYSSPWAVKAIVC